MRLLIASMVLCCGAVAGYSQETTGEAPETSAEVTIADDGSGPVVVSTDSNKEDKPAGGGCGCGKGNKPK